MADARAPLIDMAVRLLIQTLADSFVSRRSRPESLPPEIPTCKSCDIHTNVGMAYLHIKNMARLVDDDEPVSPGITNIAREYLTRAQSEIPDLMLDDRLYAIATSLGRDLVDLESRLSSIKTGKDVKALLDKADEAVDMAYDIPEIAHGSSRALKAELESIKRRLDDASGESGSEEDSGADIPTGETDRSPGDTGEPRTLAQSH